MNILKSAKRIVFKVGSSTLTHETGRMNLQRVERLACVLSDFANSGRDITLVTSGAIAAGCARMGLDHRPSATEERQATAAVGQTELMRIYDQFFGTYGYPVGQILLTRGTIEQEASRRNAENTFDTLFKLGCIPIVNENDAISCDELELLDSYGDNDTLSARVAVMIHADALVILSDIDGFYDCDPRQNPSAKLIHTVAKVDDKILSYAGGAGTERGTGGLVTKLHAARIANDAGIPMFLVNGREPSVLYDLFEGVKVGTYFMSN